jgi:microcin C transport system ATP-binding protein
MGVSDEHLLEVNELRRSYRRGAAVFSNASAGAAFTAFDGVSFSVDRGELRFDGSDLLNLRGEALRAQRRQMQMIFQDPFASLNPRMRVGEIVSEPLAIHEPGFSAAYRIERTAAILSRVGLSADAVRRYRGWTGKPTANSSNPQA